MLMKKIVIGALALVDAGKTTLAEGLLYKTNTIRKMGRVDHKDAYLDFNKLEKEKGITIFNKEARFTYKDSEFIYIDTPGHKELENERNRSLNILDGAILLISANDKTFESSKELFETLNEKYDIQRYKGLGEMDADQLWDTTMDPEKRTLIKEDIDDAALCERKISVLMGNKPELRRKWIEENIDFTLEEDYKVERHG